VIGDSASGVDFGIKKAAIESGMPNAPQRIVRNKRQRSDEPWTKSPCDEAEISQPDFAYVANATGERREGMIAADTRRAAMQRLRHKRLYPVRFRNVSRALAWRAIRVTQEVKERQMRTV